MPSPLTTNRNRLSHVRRDRLPLNTLRPGPPSASRTYLVGHEVLTNNPRWSDTDRYKFEGFLKGQTKRLPYTPNVRHLRQHMDSVTAPMPDRLATISRTRSSEVMIGLDTEGA